MKKIIDADFKLKKDYGSFKKGHVFNSYGGLVSGVQDIKFTDKEWFEPLNIKESSESIIELEHSALNLDCGI